MRSAMIEDIEPIRCLLRAHDEQAGRRSMNIIGADDDTGAMVLRNTPTPPRPRDATWKDEIQIPCIHDRDSRPSLVVSVGLLLGLVTGSLS